jgi:hypothetical protein
MANRTFILGDKAAILDDTGMSDDVGAHERWASMG